jgi:hypothetical protein
MREIHAKKGLDIECKGWEQEAVLRMLYNPNLYIRYLTLFLHEFLSLLSLPSEIISKSKIY